MSCLHLRCRSLSIAVVVALSFGGCGGDGASGASSPEAAVERFVALSVMYTGDTGQMRPPSKVVGRPVAAKTSGDQSVVSVAMRYESDPTGSTSPSPPATATIKTLVIKRDDGWWVATPEAFNPIHAAEGGYDETELVRLHQQWLTRG